ncbi:MAG TPA: bacteriohopanetetrol glucosamine biosynthesis glycosyltransferase HpnI [Stellaceae bacterium]|nr:bacteriohopanetetrol glucosamine biosynthesis glycosyltransferase HpnI [Stellaceae bacterium]
MRLTLGFAIVLVPAWGCLAAALAASLRFARRGRARARYTPPVSILKPLYGAEPGLYENLRSAAEQDYPCQQLVLGVAAREDGAVPVAGAVIGDLPERDIALVIEPRGHGSNAKVSNLINMLPAARHDVLVIADSDIRVGRGYLAAVVAPLADSRVGLVTCLYRGVPEGGLWSQLGALHVNFGFLPAALLAEALGAGGGCFGATIAIRRPVLERCGGFARLRNELADDYRIGEAVRKLGLEIVLSPYLVETRVSEPRFLDLWRHELRWARTMRLIAPAGYAGSILMYPVPLALLAAAADRFGLTSCAFLAISCLLRWASARLAAGALGLGTAKLWLLPVRDLLSFAVFLASFLGRGVVWRDQAFRVEASGCLKVDGDTVR